MRWSRSFFGRIRHRSIVGNLTSLAMMAARGLGKSRKPRGPKQILNHTCGCGAMSIHTPTKAKRFGITCYACGAYQSGKDVRRSLQGKPPSPVPVPVDVAATMAEWERGAAEARANLAAWHAKVAAGPAREAERQAQYAADRKVAIAQYAAEREAWDHMTHDERVAHLAIKAAERQAADPIGEEYRARITAKIDAETKLAWRESLRPSVQRRMALEEAAAGSHTREEWEEYAVGRCEWRCVDCGLILGDPIKSWGPEKTTGHAVPLVRGGTKYIENLLLQCRSCNSKQGTKLHPSVGCDIPRKVTGCK